MSSDRISTLPEYITENILGRLNIRDVVRTSLLSRNWRYKWTTVPCLVFDYSSLPSRPDYHGNVREDKLISLVYNILQQHTGPISKFSFSLDMLTLFSLRPANTEPNNFHIYRWITDLSRDVFFRELILKCIARRFEIPSSLFSCVNLGKLKLQGFILPSPLPTTFNGFKDLTCLDLNEVTFTNEGLENLISKCPQLSTLVMRHVHGVDILTIHHAPKLQSLHMSGSMEIKCICLNYTPNLVVVHLSCYCYRSDMDLGNGTYNINSLSNLRKFVLGPDFLKSLSQYRFPSTFYNLSEVEIDWVMFVDMNSTSAALALIKSSPNLSKLVVPTGYYYTESFPAAQLEMVTKYLEERSGSISSLNNLRCVEMKSMTGLGPEMQFIKMILGKSPLLEQMKIQHRQHIRDLEYRESEVLNELVQFPRVSAMAIIIAEETDDQHPLLVFSLTFWLVVKFP